MAVLHTVLIIAYIFVCITLTVVVIMQEGKQAGLSGAIGGGSASDSYWGKNKGRSAEGTLEKITKYLAFAFILISILLNMNIF